MTRVSVRRIQEVIASDFGISPALLRSPSRIREAAHPRQYAMLLARELTPLSTTVIGKLFGRDHSTIIIGATRAKKRAANNPVLALKLEARALLLQCEPRV